MKFFCAHNSDSDIRYNSSAGGVFSLLAEATISRGGVVYGAAFDKDWLVVHRRVESVKELSHLRKSKYLFSDFKSSLGCAVKDIESGNEVLFVGTPCQVAALRKLIGEHANLLLAEVVCHGAPRPEVWNRYLDELIAKLGRKRADIVGTDFRDKSTGWKNYSFTITFRDGRKFSQPHDENLYMRAFLADLTLRKACFSCPFKLPEGSRADVTLGDFWGISQLLPEIDNNLGTTLVIASTDKGIDAIGRLNIPEYPLILEEVGRFNPAIVSAPAIPSNLEAFDKQLISGSSLISVMKKFAGRPLSQAFRIKLARLYHQILGR